MFDFPDDFIPDCVDLSNFDFEQLKFDFIYELSPIDEYIERYLS